MIRALIERYRRDVDQLREHERQEIAEAAAAHSSMPANYWQERWAAEQKLKAAVEAALALEGRLP